MCWTTLERLPNAIYNAPVNKLIPSQLHFESCCLFFTSRTHNDFLSGLYAHGSLGSPQISLRHATVPLRVSFASVHRVSESAYTRNFPYIPLRYVLPAAGPINLTHYDIHYVLLPIHSPMHEME